MPIVTFLGSTQGRVVRVVAGSALIAGGLAAGGRWRLLAAAGTVPLGAGLFDVCVLGPLLGLPARGSAFRSRCGVR